MALSSTKRMGLALALAAIVQTLILHPVSAMTGRSNAAFVSTPLHQRASIHDDTFIRTRTNNPLMAIDPSSSFSDVSSIFLSADATAIAETAPVADNLQIEQLDPTTTVVVFIIGIIPFIWATIEFWRRIAVGASFGTGKDSVVIPSPFSETDDDGLISIGEDGNPLSSRGRQTLDRGALIVAYVLFAIAGGSVAIAIASVVMGPVPPM